MLVKTCDFTVDLDTSSDVALSSILNDGGVQLNRRCGEEGTCGGCTVILEKGTFLVNGREVTPKPDRQRRALGCRTLVVSEDAVVSVPSRSRLEVSANIQQDFVIDNKVHEPSSIRRKVTIPNPSLTDHRSDFDIIIDELNQEQGISIESSSLSILRKYTELSDLTCDHYFAYLSYSEGRWKITDLEAPGINDGNYGIAFDIGTTTVVGILVDLQTGTIVQKSSRYNQQISESDDVASRISVCRDKNDVMRQQKLLVLDTLNPIIDSLCFAQKIDRTEIRRASFAGNTVMIHTLLAIDPTSIGKIPFNPVFKAVEGLRAQDIGLEVNPMSVLDVFPAISGYVGGDVTADMLVSNMGTDQDSGTSLLIDMGTNGEIVLSHPSGCHACATPAGPAFEGGGLLHGRRASEGSIESVIISPGFEFTIKIIGTGLPNGICGSGIIDFLAQGFEVGIINHMGRFDVELLARIGRFTEIEQNGHLVKACILVESESALGNEAIVITELDVSKIMLAKSAIFSGLTTLMSACNVTLGNIDRFILAGGFARHINIGNAIKIGLIPDVAASRYEVIGNGSLGGAYLTLVNKNLTPLVQTICKTPNVIELNLVDEFESTFVNNLFFPD